MTSKIRLSRKQIAAIVGNDPEAIKQFEKLFEMADSSPDLTVFDSIEARISSLSAQLSAAQGRIDALTDLLAIVIAKQVLPHEHGNNEVMAWL